MSATEDAARFLFLVPYVAARPGGVALDELAAMLSASPAEISRLVDRAIFVGTPQGSPDEMVEAYVDADRVHVTLPQRFRRPTRFTTPELLALLLALEPLRSSASGALSALAAELSERLLGLGAEGARDRAADAQERILMAPERGEDPIHLRELERALGAGREVRAEYYTASRDAFGERTLGPISLVQHGGAWYLQALSGRAIKTFKVERFRSVRILEARFELPAELADAIHGPLFGVEEGPHRAKLRIDGEPQERSISSLPYLAAWVRSEAGGVVLEGPTELREPLLEGLRELLRVYEASPQAEPETG
ncbi:MAG: WYL domain-containing protein [Myxococcales bacterium]|nr:WYL domain-containing protein [Myxococcales bacterium]